MFDEVLLLGLHAPDALSTPPLPPVESYMSALYVTPMRDGDDHVLFGNEVLYFKIGYSLHNIRSPLIAVLIFNLNKLFLYYVHLSRAAREYAFEVFDFLYDIQILIFDLLALEPRQPLEAHLEYRRRLHLRKFELPHQGVSRGFDIGRLPYHRYDCVDVIQCDLEALEYMRAPLSGIKIETRPPENHLMPESHVFLEKALERKHHRPSVHKRQRYNTEGRLHRSVFIKLIEDDSRLGVALQLDQYSHPIPI